MMESVDQVWEDPYIETACLSPEDFANNDKLARKPFVNVVLVVCQPGSGEPEFDYSSAGRKYLWRRDALSDMTPIIYQTIEDDLGFAGEVAGSVSPWPLLRSYGEPEPADSRGVFPTNYRRKVLFTKKLKLKTSDLPHWKPKSIIGLRPFEEEDV